VKENSQYQIGGKVTWVAFSSTCKSYSQLSNFSSNSTDGSWLIIHCIEGKEVSSFSLFPDEEEVLLLPNSQFKIESILTEQMKSIMKLNPKLDVLEMSQLPTPKSERKMIIT